MYGSIRRYRVKSDNADEVMNRVRSGLLPLLERTPGSVSYHTLGPHDGELTSFTVCDSRWAIEQANRTAVDWVSITCPTCCPTPK